MGFKGYNGALPVDVKPGEEAVKVEYAVSDRKVVIMYSIVVVEVKLSQSVSYICQPTIQTGL